VEAYEFHDRYESIVTVGSFESIGSKQPDGTTELNPAVHRLMQEYGPQKQALPGQAGLGLTPRAMNGIPFDIQPVPVQVPRTSVAAAYRPSNQLLR
jgi:hypothetical protein